MKYTWLVLFFAFLLPNITIGQNHYLLDNFLAFKDGKRVILNWTIKRGSTCIGIGILRSTDQVNYELIGEFKGVCGSTESAQSYSYVDENPVDNATNYYVLEMGFSGKTDPALKIEYVDISKNGFKVVPNPIGEYGYIYFSNPNSNTHTLRIFDLNGNFVFKLNSNNDLFLIDPRWFDKLAGKIVFHYSKIWFFEIVDDRGIVINKGKFITLNGH